MTTGTLGVRGEHDWLKVTLAADQAYLFTVTGLSNYASIIVGTSTDLGSNRVSFQNFDYTAGTPDTKTVWFTPATAGTYYIDVSDPSQTGPYAVSAVTEQNDYPDTTTTTGLITVDGATATGTLGVDGEHDWQKVMLTGGQAYLFTITGLSDRSSILVGSADALSSDVAYQVQQGTGSPAVQTVWFTPATTGAYYVDLSDPGTTGPYSVSAISESNDFPQSTTTTGTVIVDGAPSVGTLGVAGEHDWMRLALTANQAYLVTVTGLSSAATIAVGTAGGLGAGVVATQVDSGADGLAATQTVWFTPAASGTYYVDISDPSTIGGYSVSAVTEHNDYPDTTATTGTVAVGGGATGGTLGVAGEHDWLRLSLSANQAYLLTVTGLSDFATVEVGSASDLSRSTVAYQTPQYPSGLAATQTVWFTPSTTGSYYVDISDPTTIGDYSVSAVAETNDHPDTTATTGVVTVGGAATTGTIGVKGEHDWLSASLTANQAYVFTVTGLSNFAGARVGSATSLDEGGTATQTPEYPQGSPGTQTVWFTPTTSDTYYIDITDPSETGTYSVTAQAVTNDFPDTTATTGVVEIACFAAGTRIATEDGLVAVEALCVGDRVRVAGAGPLAVTWIGHRDIACERHPEPEQVWPVRIAPDTFGEGQPSRPLFLSPDHAVLVDGGLVPIRRLINGASIVQIPVARVSYFHIELERHAVVFAEGLAAESYLDTGNRGLFANAAEPRVLHPRLLDGSEQTRRATLSCAPWLDDPKRIEAMWRNLAERAAAWGMPPPEVEATHEPALCVMIGDRRVQPLHRDGDRWWFVLPALDGATLVSRSAMPTAVQPWLDDHRRLGVMVRRMVLRGSARHREIAIDDPSLHDGWWNAEHGANGEPWRWTKGNAALPRLDEPTILELVLGETPLYPLSTSLDSATIRRAA